MAFDLSFIGILSITIASLWLLRRYFAGARCKISRDLYNNVIIITGSSAGIGLETARALAKKNATIIFACRNQRKTQNVIDQISKDTGNSNLHFMEVDFADLRSVKAFAKNFKKKYERLHVLINNAGMIGPFNRTLTQDRLESQFAVNYLGAFYLTNLLLDVLKRTEESRIITVSSVGQTFGKFHWDDLMLEKNYDMKEAYNQSKLANLTFIKTIQKRLDKSKMKAVAVHPGFVRTEGFRYLKKNTAFNFLVFKLGYPILAYCTKNSEQGAQTSIYCVMEDFNKLEAGAYYVDCKPADANPLAYQEENQRKLWEISEKILKGKFGDNLWDTGNE